MGWGSKCFIPTNWIIEYIRMTSESQESTNLITLLERERERERERKRKREPEVLRMMMKN
jgi:hypothetical protein